MTPQEALQKVISIIGGQTTLARHLGITSTWRASPTPRSHGISYVPTYSLARPDQDRVGTWQNIQGC